MAEEEEVPDEIEAGEQIFDLAFHGQSDLVAVGLVDGSVELWRYGVGEGNNSLALKSKHSGGASCRALQFSLDGTLLYTIGSDRRLQVLNASGQQTRVFEDAHDDSINKMHLLSEHILATGDDSGSVKVWDTRLDAGAVMEWKVHEDFVSAFAFSEEKSTLLSCGGDATLAVYDLRNAKNTSRSDDQESELQCVEIIKNGKKVVAGTQDGVVLIFSWDRWGDCSDRHPGHPESIDCMLKVDESTVLTGSSDGLIRCLGLFPHKLVGVIGDHEDFPVEAMRADRSQRLLGSIAHDSVLRFWDISMFADDEDEDEGEGGMEDEGGEGREEGACGDNEEGDGEGEEDEEEDEDAMEEDDGGDSTPFDSGSDSDEDDEAGAGGGSGGRVIKTAAQKFYQDL
jgi:WD40 repeat protein